MSTATCVGRPNGLPLMAGAGFPGSPSVNSSSPSVVSFLTVQSPVSTQKTESSGPIVIPCGIVKMSSPHERMNLPSPSNTMTGCPPRL